AANTASAIRLSVYVPAVSRTNAADVPTMRATTASTQTPRCRPYETNAPAAKAVATAAAAGTRAAASMIEAWKNEANESTVVGNPTLLARSLLGRGMTRWDAPVMP